jgi:adenine-specific DNA methylase
MINNRRLIEESFPVKEVSAESAREKSIRHGHISTLHIWWARRPLATSRATIYAALVPPPSDELEWEKQRNFIIELSKWENSNKSELIEKARDDIIRANGGVAPKILDPFAGGGSIPLEALRLGCDTYSNDYNPVAVILQKCTVEYPHKYHLRRKKFQSWGDISNNSNNYLYNDVKRWGHFVLDETMKEISQFYPSDPDGSIPVGYLWARTIPCQNPTCCAEIPLMRQYWLVKKKGKQLSLYPYIDENKINFKIVGDGVEKIPIGFDPDKGTVNRAVVICPFCGSAIDGNTTKKIFQVGKSSQRMICVVLHKPNETGKRYRIANALDEEKYKNSSKYLDTINQSIKNVDNFEPIPDEPTPEGKGSGAERAFSVRNYSMNIWGDLIISGNY